MEATMKMSNLVLPQGFVEMDKDEMMYVEGGKSKYYYTSQNALERATIALGFTAISMYGWLGGTVLGILGMGLLAVPEPTLVTKVFGALSIAAGWYVKFMAGSAAVCAIIAAERNVKGQNFRIGIETIFGIPVSFIVS